MNWTLITFKDQYRGIGFQGLTNNLVAFPFSPDDDGSLGMQWAPVSSPGGFYFLSRTFNFSISGVGRGGPRPRQIYISEASQQIVWKPSTWVSSFLCAYLPLSSSDLLQSLLLHPHFETRAFPATKLFLLMPSFFLRSRLGQRCYEHPLVSLVSTFTSPFAYTRTKSRGSSLPSTTVSDCIHYLCHIHTFLRYFPVPKLGQSSYLCWLYFVVASFFTDCFSAECCATKFC